MHKTPGPLVASVIILLSFASPAAAQAIPKPEDILGFKPGDDYHLATYTQAIAYFRKLAENSDRIKLLDMGKSSLGLTMTYAVISSPENLGRLERHKSIARDLSQAKGLSPDDAVRLAAEGRAIVYVDGGLHANECAPAQHNIQLAYDLVSAKDPRTLRILDDIILLVVFPNPDGMNMLAEWYHPNVGTPYEVSPMPWLYHKYAGHDNNRDSYMANLVETQNLTRLVHQEWFPVVLYNHHQTAPFPARIWIPPNSEPTNPNVHPLVVRWQNLIGSAMGAAFDQAGQEGAISRVIFDTWYPGYVSQVVDSHNIISIMTETALYEYATPHFYTIRDFPKEYQDFTMSAFYPSPWKGGWWRLRDAVDYCLTATKAVLETASKYRQELLFNKFKMGQDVIERFKTEPPYAWIIPEKQPDSPSVCLLLNRMILLGVDVYQSREEFTCDGLRFPSGTYIIPMTQANALFVKNIFEEQRYPDLRKYPDLWQGLVRTQKFEGSPFEAYDMMGWTLPYQFGAKLAAANSPLDVPMDRRQEASPPVGEVVGGSGPAYLLSPETNGSFTAVNRILKKGGKVERARKSFATGGKTYPEGTFVASGIDRPFVLNLARDLHLKVEAASAGQADRSSLKKPRLGIYQSWISSEDEGWTRYVLEQFEFPFAVLHDADIRAGGLAESCDVIIIPDHWSPELILEGYSKGMMPPAYVGGITANGLRNLKLFTEAGGRLIFLNGICNLALDNFGLAARNTLKGVKRDDFVCTGSLVRVEFDPGHPLCYGMPKEGAGVFLGSCAFDILPSFESKKEPKSAARYAEENLLMSGWIYGEKFIQQKSTVLDVPYGNGRVILLGFPVQFRGQPYGTFKLLFNAIFYF
ncbi:MAG: M14 metallopeptidase family protein [Acidobacteriota bacterium]